MANSGYSGFTKDNIMKDAGNYEKAQSDAIKFIKYRPRSVSEVRERLNLKKYSGEIIDKVIQYLSEISLLDDVVFAKMWVNGRILSKNFGPVKIKAELSHKGIPNEVILEIVENAYSENDENSLAENVLRKKYRNDPNCMDFQKAVNLLVRKGFSYSVSKSAVKKFQEKF